MTTHEDTQVDGAQPPTGPTAPMKAPMKAPSKPSRRATRADRRSAAPADVAGAPSWWHRSHPVFTSVAGFFTGLLTLVVVPTIFGAVVGSLFSYDTAQRLAPYVLVIFVVPLLVIAVPRTRRFGLFMLVGMLATAVVAAAAAALTLWYLFAHTG